MIQSLDKLVFTVAFLWLFALSANAQQSAFLKFNSNVDSLFLVVDFRYSNARKIANGDSIPIAPGHHILEMSVLHGASGPQNYFVSSGTTLDVTYYFDQSRQITPEGLDQNFAAKQELGLSALILTDPNTKIFVNREFVAMGSATIPISDFGTEVRLKNTRFGSRSYQISNEPNFMVLEEFRQPRKEIAYALAPLPGMSQLYKRQYLRSALIISSLIFPFHLKKEADNDYKQLYTEFEALVNAYNRTRNESLALEYATQIEGLQKDLRYLDSKSNFYLATTIAFYALNIFDGLYGKPRGGYQDKNFNIELDATPNPTLRVNFK